MSIISKFKQVFSRNHQTIKSNADGKYWYYDRYNKIIVQRNILFLFTICCFVLMTVSIIAVMKISTSKQFEPFVIQIEEKTGITSIVNPISSKVLKGDDELAKYFIRRYLIARESYNAVDFDKIARKTIRLMSNNNIYYQYSNYIRKKDNDPRKKYGEKSSTYIKIKSWSKLTDSKFMIRFDIHEVSQMQKVSHKIAIVDFEYVPMELNDEEKEINPIGFVVTGYRVDDDNS